MKKDTQEAAFRQRVFEYQRKGHSMTGTANRYHISRKTVLTLLQGKSVTYV